MSITIKLSGEDRSSGHFFRSAELRIGSGESKPFLATWNNKLSLAPESSAWPQLISEVFAQPTIQELRAIASYAEDQALYVKS